MATSARIVATMILTMRAAGSSRPYMPRMRRGLPSPGGGGSTAGAERSEARRSGWGERSGAWRSPHPARTQPSLRRLRKLACDARDPPPPGEGGLAARVFETVCVSTRLCTRLLQPNVLREVVARAALALEAPADGLGVVARAEHLGQELLLRGPAGVGLRLAITARHGVVEPAVRRVLVNVDVVGLLVLL